MNEPASFCKFPCEDPEDQAAKRNFPPEPPAVREPPRTIPDFPSSGESLEVRQGRRDWSQEPSYVGVHQQQPLKASAEHGKSGHEGDDLLFPPYRINNHVGELGEQTMHPNLQHANGLWTYDAHNLYGACKSQLVPTSKMELTNVA